MNRIRRLASRRGFWPAALVGMLLVPLLFFGILETTLRVLGYGSPTTYFIPIPGQETVTANPRFGWQFFPKGLAQEPILTRMPLRKPAGTRRVFVLGASVTAGVPDVAFSFSRILRTMLTAAYPDHKFEVVNTGIPAINSHVVRRIAAEALDYEPDLLVIYLGHTEMIGPYGAATALDTRSRSMLGIRVDMAWRRTRTGQWIEAIAARLRGNSGWQRWRGMEMFAGARIHPEDRRLKTGYRHFERNLQSICEAASRRGVPVLLCTTPSNLKDCPPFASELRPRLGRKQRQSWQTQFGLGVDLEREGLPDEALQAYEAALGIDPTHAELQFRMARCLATLGQTAASRPHYIAARDNDALRFRADTRLNAIVRSTAKANPKAGLLDLEALFNDDALDGVPGSDFFYEQAHLHFEGNYAVARHLYGAMTNRLAAAGLNVTGPLPDADGCARRLAFTGWNRWRMADEMLRIVERPPFTGQIDHALSIAAQRRVLGLLERYTTQAQLAEALKHSQAAIRLRPDDLLLRVNDARMAIRANDAARALKQWRLLLDQLPQNPNLHYNMGTTLARIGNREAAADHVRQALALNPFDPRAHNNLGNLAYAHKETADAIRHFKKALSLDPEFAEAQNNLGAVYAAQGKHEKAIPHFRRAIAARAGYPEAFNNLGSSLYVLKRLDEGRQAYEEALRLNQNYTDARINLARAFYKERDLAAALMHFQWLCRQQPQDPMFHYELGAVYAGLSRLREARAEFAQALLFKPDWKEAKTALEKINAMQQR